MKYNYTETHLEALIHNYFDFLIDKYNMTFMANIYSEYRGFAGPVFVFSYFNRYGCLSVHYVAQKDELGIYSARNYSDNQYELLEREISTTLMGIHRVYTKRRLFLELSKHISKEAEISGTALGIKV